MDLLLFYHAFNFLYYVYVNQHVFKKLMLSSNVSFVISQSIISYNIIINSIFKILKKIILRKGVGINLLIHHTTLFFHTAKTYYFEILRN